MSALAWSLMGRSEDVIRSGFEALSIGDQRLLRDRIFAADAKWHEPGRNLLSGDYRDRGEILVFLVERLRELSAGSYRIEVEEVIEDRDLVVGICVSTAIRNDRALSSRDLYLARMDGGKIRESWAYHLDQPAWDKFWS